MNQSVVVDKRDDVVIIRLNRPPANAIDVDTATALHEALTDVQAMDPLLPLILTGTGDCFCGGLDLKAIPAYDPATRQRLLLELGEAVFDLYAYPEPVVAALNGHAVAAGTLLTLCADHRIAPERDCKFGLTGIRVGIPYPDIAIAVVRAELTPAVARRLLLHAATIESDQAAVAGVVDELVPRADVFDRATEVARALASMPGTSYGDVKRQLRAETITRLEMLLQEARYDASGTWIAEL